MGAYTDKNWENDRLLPDNYATTTITESSPPPQRSNTAYLDGLRGLAALCVYIHHFIYGFTNLHGHGFGENGHYHFVSLPFIRFLWSGGDAGVAIFFILSGYVLSVGSFRKLKSEKTAEVRKGLLSALIRRPIRLYFPPLAVSFIVALLLQIPGLMLSDAFSKPQATLGAEMYNWFWSCYYYFSIFRNHVPGGFFYDSVVWTLPIELKGSLLVYGALAVFSLGLTGLDQRVPRMMAIFIFICAAIMIQMAWKWSMAEFLLGMVLAIVDVWGLDTYITGGDASNVLEKARVPPEVSRLVLKLCQTASICTQKLMRRTAILMTRLVPRSLVRHILPTLQQARLPPSERRQSTWVPNIGFFIGWYILCQPAAPKHRYMSLETPGWRWLTQAIPAVYDEEYFRYWNAWGAFMVVWSLLHLPWLQRFFCTRPLQFLGRISFMLYLIHFPYFRTLPGRLISLFGGATNEVVKDSFWDKTLAFPDVGPVGLSSRFCVVLSITLPIAMILARFGTVIIDEPSVRMGKWLTESIGLDQRRPRKVEGVSLPV